MKTITISLTDATADETVQAEYFQIEDGWVTFKTEDHKAVVAYPEARITRIKTETTEISDARAVAYAAVGGQRFLVEAFDNGFTACAHEHTKQRNDPSHPITRVNPYAAGRA